MKVNPNTVMMTAALVLLLGMAYYIDKAVSAVSDPISDAISTAGDIPAGMGDAMDQLLEMRPYETVPVPLRVSEIVEGEVVAIPSIGVGYQERTFDATKEYKGRGMFGFNDTTIELSNVTYATITNQTLGDNWMTYDSATNTYYVQLPQPELIGVYTVGVVEIEIEEGFAIEMFDIFGADGIPSTEAQQELGEMALNMALADNLVYTAASCAAAETIEPLIVATATNYAAAPSVIVLSDMPHMSTVEDFEAACRLVSESTSRALQPDEVELINANFGQSSSVAVVTPDRVAEVVELSPGN